MKLETFLKERGIDYEKHTHTVMYTAQRLAAAEQVTGYMVAKPVIVVGASTPTMCVLQAPKHLDLKRFADGLDQALDGSRRNTA